MHSPPSIALVNFNNKLVMLGKKNESGPNVKIVFILYYNILLSIYYLLSSVYIHT